MFFTHKQVRLMLVGFLFFIGIIVTSHNMWVGTSVILFSFGILYKKMEKDRFLLSLFISFLLSFLIFQLANLFIENLELPKEWNILFNRSLLILIMAGLYIAHRIHKRNVSLFNQKPQWNQVLELPFHTISLSRFMLIGLIIHLAIFVPMSLQQKGSDLPSLLLFCLAFSIINAVCEEVIWRGILLSSLKELVSVRYAIVITSIGFGLLHLSIGFSFPISLLFSFGGLFYAVITVKTNSLYPAILFHLMVNIGMVLSGWIV